MTSAQRLTGPRRGDAPAEMVQITGVGVDVSRAVTSSKGIIAPTTYFLTP